MIALILSLFTGTLNFDWFYLGQIGLGIGKLLTVGSFDLWALIDWFLIMKAAKNIN
ncbi:TM2 domain-containing protein [Vagococcus vulneris]|uniref:TM2 domain-containing protein n=1 Tax=Vagococcus vulneris TaxID=1977869 RepID=A0A429ZZB9_9ENTE|nr:TM2 domain-containing protein [Vagococcus vulneris]RST99362.1 hypothetical protein CBF37_05165 [Vagococcus vulneris]